MAFARVRLPWWRRSDESESTGRNGVRIAVIGNCQARVLSRCLSVLVPKARIDYRPMGRLGKDQHSLEAFAGTLERHDLVFTQVFPKGFFPDGGSDELLARLPKTRAFPAIVFSAFHPDLVYVGELDSMVTTRLVPSPLHTYHSAIALFAHLRDVPARRIPGLFREEVFAALGYLDAWSHAAAELAASAAAAGFDLSQDLTRWSRQGAFMHAINHPKLTVMADLAARLLREAGIELASVSVESYLADELLDDTIWPIYPAVAEIYGLQGSYLFKRRGKPRDMPVFLDLETFVAQSVAIYEQHTKAQLGCHRVANWASRPEICRMFDAV